MGVGFLVTLLHMQCVQLHFEISGYLYSWSALHASFYLIIPRWPVCVEEDTKFTAMSCFHRLYEKSLFCSKLYQLPSGGCNLVSEHFIIFCM